jgi:outer membrane protein TolC
MNKIIAAIVIFVLSGAVYSQNVRTLTLYDAINLAKKNNSDYILAKLDKLKAEKKVSQVYSENLVPSMSLSSRYTRNFKKQTINIFGETFELGSDNSIITSFDVTQSIPFLGTPIMNGIRIAEYYEKIQDENIKRTEANVKADVKKAFYTVVLLKEVIKVNTEGITNATENLRVVEARYKAGVALEYDYIRAKVALETLTPQLSQSQNNLEIAKKNLKNAIGLKDNQDVDVTGTIAYDSTEVWGSTDDLIRSISEKNVAVRQLKLNKKINEELVDVEFANYLPKLYLFGQYLLQANEDDNRSVTLYRFNNAVLAGIGLSWNLNVFSTGYKEDQSEIEVKKSDEQILKTKELLKTQAESVLLKIEDAKNRVRVQKENVTTAERGYELANISYKSGVLNQIDVVNAQLALSQIQLTYLQAIYDYLIARTDLEQLLEK